MIIADDRIIIEQITKGTDPEKGYRMLVSMFKERLYWHIRRMVGEHEDADDILQNTFVKVIKNINGFKMQSSLQTWLYRIATNECITFLNKKNSRKVTPLNSAYDTNGVSGLYQEADEILSKLEQAINRLPDKQKAVFLMRYYDELPYSEIAEITETSTGALKATYHHAVKKIEEFIIDGHD
ncbi:MAG: RNA polymerase sigma factor [Saprospiraceae bacterium]|nr:MAG: ECF subfamily RNA polymerase sigma-24 subunit [Bacteroidetes bacterium OLB9]MCO6463811.1 RNA polymerase sigma factor [Saprospiraceae bacterium]MCZ2337125.1 RNA polymerase sigma factor [Chitinophagales bacterium]